MNLLYPAIKNQCARHNLASFRICYCSSDNLVLEHKQLDVMEDEYEYDEDSKILNPSLFDYFPESRSESKDCQGKKHDTIPSNHYSISVGYLMVSSG